MINRTSENINMAYDCSVDSGLLINKLFKFMLNPFPNAKAELAIKYTTTRLTGRYGLLP